MGEDLTSVGTVDVRQCSDWPGSVCPQHGYQDFKAREEFSFLFSRIRFTENPVAVASVSKAPVPVRSTEIRWRHRHTSEAEISQDFNCVLCSHVKGITKVENREKIRALFLGLGLTLKAHDVFWIEE